MALLCWDNLWEGDNVYLGAIMLTSRRFGLFVVRANSIGVVARTHVPE